MSSALNLVKQINIFETNGTVKLSKSSLKRQLIPTHKEVEAAEVMKAKEENTKHLKQIYLKIYGDNMNYQDLSGETSMSSALNLVKQINIIKTN